MHLKIGVQADGTPTAIALQATMNAGAFVASGMNVTRRVGQGALYLYTCPNARFEGSDRRIRIVRPVARSEVWGHPWDTLHWRS